jgi:hypothetical protein
VGFPASSPLGTAIGGTNLMMDTHGHYQSEAVWNDDGCCAGGGGSSQIFPAPIYQQLTLPKTVRAELGRMRGLPDVSYNAECNNAITVYLSYFGASEAGYYGICGTSAGSPLWAGIVADLNQYAGRPLGFLNPALYALGGFGRFSSFGRDITVGNNELLDVPGAVAPGVFSDARMGSGDRLGLAQPRRAPGPRLRVARALGPRCKARCSGLTISSRPRAGAFAQARRTRRIALVCRIERCSAAFAISRKSCV